MRILIVKLSSLGDILHVLPAAAAIQRGTGATLDWAVQPEYAGLVGCFTVVDRVIPVPRDWYRQAPRSTVNRLRATAYDAVVDLQGLFKSAIVTRLARAPVRLGPSYHRECSRLFYTRVAGRRDIRRHAVIQALDSARALLPAGPAPAVEFPVAFPAVAVDTPRPRVALVPASRWPTKNWPAPAFHALAARLQREAGASIHLVGGPGETGLCGEIARDLPGTTVVEAGRHTIPQTGGLLAHMDLVIANDTGPIHLAAALGTPVLALFGPTDPRRTGPYGAGHRVLMRDLPCQPCYARTCRIGGMPCLAGLPVAQVCDAALTMLAARRSGDGLPRDGH